MRVRTCDEEPRGRISVLHVDHTSEFGGAELALARILRANPSWTPILALPRSTPEGVYEGLVALRIGPPQPSLQKSESGKVRHAVGGLHAASRLIAGSIEWACSRRVRRVDVIHANTTRAALMLVPLALTGGPPIVLHLRDRAVASEVGRLNALVLRLFARFLAAAVIANSRSTLRSLGPTRRGRASEHVIFSHAGVSRRELAWQANPSRGELRVLHLARLAPWKGQKLAIDATQRLKEMGVPVKLYIAGSEQFGRTNQRLELEEYALRIGIAERVEFLGHVDSVTETIDSMDVCLQTSLRPEPLGQNIIQYMLRGAPTIVSGEGGPLELVSHGVSGLIFTPGDCDDLVSKIVYLWQNPDDAARMAGNALAESSRFDGDELLLRYEEVFLGVASQ